ncbi:MAG: hypothetical protein K0Q92_639 [Steroidobacteraceae bacterium]|jgi:hypothetical protein|nr:hypothetical protein [Steroidobacteraceae bacterium]
MDIRDEEGDGLGLGRALVYLVPISLGFWLGVIWYFMK